jgi:hypothetical protein
MAEPSTCVVGSLIGHVALLAAMAGAIPPLGDGPESDELPEQRYVFVPIVGAPGEQELAEDEPLGDGWGGVPDPTGAHDPGSMGEPQSRSEEGRYGVQGPLDNPDPHIAHAPSTGTAPRVCDFCSGEAAAGERFAPTAPWGRDTSLGNDAWSARGNFWAESIGSAFGAAGLGLRGIEEASGAGTGPGSAPFARDSRCLLP